MKLPKLPPLKRSKGSTSPGRAALPPLPRMSKPAEPTAPAPVDSYDEVEPMEGESTDEGRWFRVARAKWFGRWEPASTEWGGRCCRCGKLKKAENLRYRIGPFAHWAGWTCRVCWPFEVRPRRSVTQRSKRSI